jgi:hypothetical protein
LRIEGLPRGQRSESHDRNLCFLDRSRYFLIQVAPQLTSRNRDEKCLQRGTDWGFK